MTAPTICICFYCDRPLSWDTAYLLPFGKTSCRECFEEFR